MPVPVTGCLAFSIIQHLLKQSQRRKHIHTLPQATSEHDSKIVLSKAQEEKATYLKRYLDDDTQKKMGYFQFNGEF